MAFWGVEVKPGKPFTHFFDSVRGRLRISQATLGIGSATKRSLVQCNVGNKSPVLLCSLLPDKTESCSLDLEFEEANEVMFSVIGPRSVHLTGYYLRHGGHSNLNDDTDSYGEDIGHTESEESNRLSDEDDYDDSFIDDSDLEAYPPSPLSNSEVASEDTSDDIKPKSRKGRKRLKKKYQLSESDTEDKPQKQKVVNRRNVSVISESEDEDNLPISTLYKTENNAPNTKLEEEEERKDNESGERGKEKEEHGNIVSESYRKAEVVAVDGEPERQSSLLVNSLKPPSEVAGPEIDMKPKKKRKERSKKKKALENWSLNNTTALEEDKTKQVDASNSTGQDPPLKNQQDQAANGNGKDLPHTRSLSPNEISPENDAATPKKKRRKMSDDKKILEVDNVFHSNVFEEDKGQQVGAKADNICQDQSLRKEPDSKPANDKTLNNCTDHFAGEKQSEEKKTKKNKRSKTQEIDENVNANLPLLSKHSQVKTLSNGLTIEELKMGKSDGKVASQGKKVNVLFIGKLKENGHVVDSKSDGAPYKFRLGVGKVIEGLDVGIDGMRVGDKRRLTIPPSLGYGSKGDIENVPPNSWLVYDVELVGAR